MSIPALTEPTLVTASTGPRPRLGELLVQAGKLTERDLERALSVQQELGGLLGSVLARLGLVSELDIARTLAPQLGVPLVTADDFPDLISRPDARGRGPAA